MGQLNLFYNDWINDVSELLLCKYGVGIPDCTDDKEMQRCFDNGETPEEFVEWKAEKYGMEASGDYK